MSLWRTFRDRVLGEVATTAGLSGLGHRTWHGVEYSPPPPDPTTPPPPDPTTPPPTPAAPPKRRYIDEVRPEARALARELQEAAEAELAKLTRPDVIVGQTLEAARRYRTVRGWEYGGYRPRVMSTAPGDHHGRIVLVITDPPKLDPDLWKQLRDRDRLTCVVRP